MPEGMRDFDRGIAPVKATGGGIVVPPVIFGPAYPWTWVCPVGGRWTWRVWGPGGGGGVYGGGQVAGSGAGGFCRKTVKLAKGDIVSGVCGQPGGGDANNSLREPTGPTIVNLPDGTVMTANAGGPVGIGVFYVKRGAADNELRGSLGGTATGGDLNLTGGNGGSTDNTLPSTAGQGSFSGVPGAYHPSYQCGGGGSAPGDEFLKGGDGGRGFYSNGRQPISGNNGGGSGSWPGGGAGGGYQYEGGWGGDGAVIATYEGA